MQAFYLVIVMLSAEIIFAQLLRWFSAVAVCTNHFYLVMCLQLNTDLFPRGKDRYWQLVYSIDRDGTSLQTLYRKMMEFSDNAPPCILVIRDSSRTVRTCFLCFFMLFSFVCLCYFSMTRPLVHHCGLVRFFEISKYRMYLDNWNLFCALAYSR